MAHRVPPQFGSAVPAVNGAVVRHYVLHENPHRRQVIRFFRRPRISRRIPSPLHLGHFRSLFLLIALLTELVKRNAVVATVDILSDRLAHRFAFGPFAVTFGWISRR